MKKLRLFDSLKFVLATVACVFAFAPAHSATLPAGYTELEYLQTDGNSWIDTGIKGDMSYKYEIDFQQLDAGQNRNWGAFDQSGYNGGPNMSLTYSSGFAVRWTVSGNPNQLVDRLSSLDSNRHHIIIDNGYVTWDGVNKGRSTGHQDNYVFRYNLFLGTVNPGGNTPTSNAKSKYYLYKVWNTSGELIQDLIPAKNSSGVVGMYDMVSGQFFTNAGTGEFIAGEYQIKIATTRYNEQQFAPVETRLDAARTVINDLITQMQTNAVNVSKLAVEKQTRPNATCPVGKNCLLVTDPNGAENWYEIVGADAVQSSSNVPDYFSFTTTALNAGDSVGFSLTPSGTFTVDWGDGTTPEVIERTNPASSNDNEELYVYGHTYATGGAKTVKITGHATGYSTDVPTVFGFVNTSQITSIDGCLGAIFPTLGNGAGQQPLFRDTFRSTQITSIPAGLFSGVTGAAGSMFSGTFQDTPITSIPTGLFSGITGAADYMFENTFGGTQITSIPENLFSGVTGAAKSMFDGTFAYTPITSIPAGLFSGVTGAAESMFGITFLETQITSIPENLFSGVTGAADQMFDDTFGGTPITSIPAGLFSGVTGAADRMFRNTFEATQITSIPAGLFSGITGAAPYMFVGTFVGCSNLTGYIPESTFAGLIQNNSPDAGGFMDEMFYDSTGMATACPQNTTEVSTPYKSKYWDTTDYNGNYAVMCRPN